MQLRLAPVFLILLAVPVLSQHSTTGGQMQQWVWSRGQMMRPDSAPELDPRVAQLEAIHHDAADLSTLSTSLESDLQQLQKGKLAKDLGEKLKKVEKLSRKLRQELSQ